MEGKKSGEDKGFDQYGEIGRTPAANNWLVNPKKGQNYFGSNGEDITHPISTPTGWKPMDELKRGAGHQGWSLERTQAEWAKENAEWEAKRHAEDVARWQQMSGQWQGNDSSLNTWGQSPFTISKGGSFGEPIQMPTIELPENPLDKWFNFDGAGERLSALASQLLEGFGNIATGAGELFQGIVETAGSALASLGEVAASALEGVSSAFTAAKDTVLSVWSEVPGFFSGILSGLGGAAEAAGSAIYSGLTSVIGSIIGAWEGAAGTISGIISNISAMGANVGATVSGVIARVRGHAEGGFVTSPELAMIGERGAELILPLTDRERSLDLLSQASSVLGISEELSPSGSSNASSSSGANIEMNVTFNISGENSQDIVEAIKERIQEIADAAATQLSMTLSDAHHNRVLEA